MERIVISDTNIFIDLWTMRLLGKFFMLPFEIHTVDMVLAEITDSNQNEEITIAIKNGRLGVEEIQPTELPDVLKLMSGNLTVTDAAVWYTAKKKSALLLSGDNKLRRLAESDNVRVAGILYILDVLIEHGIIAAGYAAECLELLKGKNKRLPLAEVDNRLNNWTQLNKHKEEGM